VTRALAGPIFTEWYWGPLFFLFFFTPVVLGAALFIDYLVERSRGPRPLRRRALLVAGIYVAAVVLIFGLPDLRGDGRPEVETVSRLDFTPYAPDALPRTFRQNDARTGDPFGRPVLMTILGLEDGGLMHAYQQRRAGGLSLQNGRCRLTRLAVTAKSYDAPCRELHTRQGTKVFVGVPQGATGAFAFALLDDTLIQLEGSQPDDRDLLAYVDSLHPVDQDELELTPS
jgi:hypothetical protein